METPADNRPDPLLGTTIDGRFEIKRVIGHGGMGVVYEAHQRGLEVPVAVKVLNAKFARKPEVIKRFQMEAKVASALKHTNLVATHAFGLLDNVAPYLVMEYLDGISLSDFLKEQKKFDKDLFISVFTQCCAGLTALHESGVIHRDIKPSNIMVLKQSDGKYLVKVTDYGIAKQEEDLGGVGLTKTGDIIGTPMYMSPEQCEGKPVDHRVDIYSLGCVMYEWMCGKPPFASDTPFEVMLAHVNSEPESPTEKHIHLRKIRPLVDAVMHALQKAPDARPQTAEKFRAELLEAQKGVSNFKRKRVLRFPVWSWKVAAVAAFMAFVVTCAFAMQNNKSAFAPPEQTVNPRDPDSLFEHAQKLEQQGRYDEAPREYAHAVELMFEKDATLDGFWTLKPQYRDEAHLHKAFIAAPICDAIKDNGWPTKDYWYRARNALDAYYADTHILPPYVTPTFKAKIATIFKSIENCKDRAGVHRQLSLALNLEDSLRNIYSDLAVREKDPVKKLEYQKEAAQAEQLWHQIDKRQKNIRSECQSAQ